MTYLKKLGLLLTICGLFVTVLISAFPQQAAAAELATDYGLTVSGGKANLSTSDFTLRWVDAAHIEMKFKNGQILIFVPGGISNNGGSDLRDERWSDENGGGVKYVNKNFGCDNEITFDINEDASTDAKTATKLTTGKLDIDFRPEPGYECTDTNPNDLSVNVSNPDMSIAYFGWIDSGRIQMVDGQSPGIFTRAAEGSNIFLRDSENGKDCQDKLVLDPGAYGGNGSVRYYELDGGFGGNPPADVGAGGCHYRIDDGFPTSNKEWPLAWPENKGKDAGTGTSTLDPDADNGSGTPIELNCDFSFTNPLSWFMCPLVEGASHAIQALDKAINGQLTISISTYFNENDPNGGRRLYQAWSVMRSMALALLVIIALIMVISQAVSSGPFDAYTVKKVLPRIVLAVVLTTLSWQICKLLISVSNDFGQGIGTVISSPFQGLSNPTIGAEGQSIGAIGAIAGFFSGIDILVILSFVLTGLAALMIAFAVIAFRNILVILLVITAPAALIFWILPNTQKAWKFWKDNFGAVLLAFPIIVAFITTGKIFAIITSNAGGGVDDNLFRDIIIFIAYFGPYFALPAAFRLAGGAIATIGGVANDRSKGFFDRNKKFRADEKKHAFERRKSGNALNWAQEGSKGAKFNKGVEAVMGFRKAGFDPRRMRTKMRTAMNEAADHEVEEINKANFVWGGDDAKVAAARYDSREDIARELERMDAGRFGGPQNARAREDATEQILRDKKRFSNESFQRWRIRAQAKTGTGYQDPNTGEFNAALMLQDINDAYGNDANGAGRALAEMRGSLQQSGQIAGAAGFGTWAGALTQYQNAINDPHATPASIQAAQQVAHETILDNAIDSAQPGLAIYGKPSSARAFAAAHARRTQRIVDGIQSGAINPLTQQVYSQRDLDQQLASTMGVYDAMAQSSPQNARAMADGLMNHQITDNNGRVGTVFDMANDPTTVNNPAFQQMRRDFGSAAQQQAAQQAGQQAQAAQAGNVGGMPGQPGQPNSDKRLKKDIVLLGRLEDGTNVYRFRYLWSNELYVGVVAQEILFTYPEAIGLDTFGFYTVDYDILGIEFMTYEKWQSSNKKEQIQTKLSN